MLPQMTFFRERLSTGGRAAFLRSERPLQNVYNGGKLQFYGAADIFSKTSPMLAGEFLPYDAISVSEMELELCCYH